MKSYAAVALLCVVVGIAIGLRIADGDARREVISHMPAIIQADGSIILERTPLDVAKPLHKIPADAVVERQISVTVKPAGETARLDLSLVEQNGGRRVIASSPDGEIIGGMDMPITSALLPPSPRRWAAGASYDPIHRTPGAWIERDFSRLRLGAEARSDGLQLRIGLTF